MIIFGILQMGTEALQGPIVPEGWNQALIQVCLSWFVASSGWKWTALLSRSLLRRQKWADGLFRDFTAFSPAELIGLMVKTTSPHLDVAPGRRIHLSFLIWVMAITTELKGWWQEQPWRGSCGDRECSTLHRYFLSLFMVLTLWSWFHQDTPGRMTLLSFLTCYLLRLDLFHGLHHVRPCLGSARHLRKHLRIKWQREAPQSSTVKW